MASTQPPVRSADASTVRVGAIELPVFVADGDGDPMILPRCAHLLAGLGPDARRTIDPDAAHGFRFQHHRHLAADVHAVLGEAH